MDKHNFYGNHILAELYCVETQALNNIKLLIKTLKTGINRAQATCVKTFIHRFKPYGFTIISVLQESHVSIHAYPERNAVFFDAFTCGKSQPIEILKEVTAFLKPQKTVVNSLRRGIIESFSEM